MSKRFAKQERECLRVDFEADGYALDDLAIGGAHIHLLRLEDMGDGAFWGAIHLKDGRTLTLSFYAERKGLLKAGGEWS